MTNEIVFKGEFNKKKTWFPSLLILAAIIFPILALVFKFMNLLLAIAIAVVVLIIAIILLSIKPKNTLTITAKCIRIKQGKKFYWIPIDKITYLDMGNKNSVGIGTA
jgi:membrane protein YdbS with pleckstrin-like domain